MKSATATTTPKSSHITCLYQASQPGLQASWPALPRSRLMPVLFSKISVRINQKVSWPKPG